MNKWQISNLTVDKVSLIEKWDKPAVKDAVVQIFKWFSWKKEKLTKDQKKILKKIANIN